MPKASIAQPATPEGGELQRLPRRVPVLTPPAAPRTTRPFVVSPPAPAPAAAGFLAAPALRVARVTLARYARSSWLLVDLVGVVAIWAVTLRGTVTPASFFEAAGIGTALLTILSTYGILQVMPPRVYLRLVPRRDYRAALAGIVLANSVVRAVLALILLLVTLVLHDLVFASAPAVLAGMLGLIANCALIGTISVALAPPVVGRFWRECFLALIILALYSYNASGTLAQVLAVTRVILLPIAACYNMGQTGELGRSGLLALLGVTALVAGIVSLAAFALSRRHAPQGTRQLRALTLPTARKTHAR